MLILEKYAKKLRRLIGLILLISLFLLFINVVLRYFFGNSLTWVESTTIYLVIWVVFLGTGLVFFDDEHLSMGIVYDKLSNKAKNRIDLINNFLIIITSLMILFFGSIVTVQLYSLGQRSLDGNIPIFIVMLSIPLGALIAIITLCVDTIKRLQHK